MRVDIPSLQRALSGIPGALIGQAFAEPVWLSDATEERVLRTTAPVIISLDDGEREQAEYDVTRFAKGIKASGVEAIAWYRTFRTQHAPWGVFIRVEAAVAAAQQAFGTLHASDAERVQLMYRSLLAHELAHFDVDFAVAQFELLVRHAVWYPRKLSIWPKGNYDTDEETVANAAMIRTISSTSRFRWISGQAAALRDWTLQQPAGYSEGWRYRSDEKFRDRLDKLGAQYLGSSPISHTIDGAIALRPIVEAERMLGRPEVPIYLVYDATQFRVGDLGLFPAVQIVAEANGFQKQLIKSPRRTQRDYKELRERISGRTPSPGDQFKKWPPLGKDYWSLKLNAGDRLHVRHLEGTNFEAIEIGSHGALGHG